MPEPVPPRHETPVLVLISVDPRESHRANEAMRIGLGVIAGEHPVTFVLAGPAAHLLDAETDDLVDGDDIAKFRANLRSLGVPFHVEHDAMPADPDWNAERHPVVPTSLASIAQMIRGSSRVIVF